MIEDVVRVKGPPQCSSTSSVTLAITSSHFRDVAVCLTTLSLIDGTLEGP